MRRASRPSAAEAYRPWGLGSRGVVAVGPQATLLAGYCAHGPSLRVVAGHPIKLRGAPRDQYGYGGIVVPVGLAGIVLVPGLAPAGADTLITCQVPPKLTTPS